MIKVKLMYRLCLVVSLLLIPAIFASANGSNEEGVIFPVWTYYAEIVEHGLIISIAIFVLYRILTRTRKKTGVTNHLILGFIALAIGESLTIMHHFLIYPFGIYNAIVHHGLLLVSIVFISFSCIKSIR